MVLRAVAQADIPLVRGIRGGWGLFSVSVLYSVTETTACVTPTTSLCAKSESITMPFTGDISDVILHVALIVRKDFIVNGSVDETAICFKQYAAAYWEQQ